MYIIILPVIGLHSFGGTGVLLRQDFAWMLLFFIDEAFDFSDKFWRLFTWRLPETSSTANFYSHSQFFVVENLIKPNGMGFIDLRQKSPTVIV